MGSKKCLGNESAFSVCGWAVLYRKDGRSATKNDLWLRFRKNVTLLFYSNVNIMDFAQRVRNQKVVSTTFFDSKRLFRAFFGKTACMAY